MKNLLMFSLMVGLCSGCNFTYEVMLTDTHGQSSDVVDDTTRSDQQVDPNVSVPVSVILPVTI
jgi:hypothetical protein